MTGRANKRSSLRSLRAELLEVEAKINALYWAFTRQARAKPPCVVAPELYTRRRELNDEIRVRSR